MQKVFCAFVNLNHNTVSFVMWFSSPYFDDMFLDEFDDLPVPAVNTSDGCRKESPITIDNSPTCSSKVN